jgi:hypothetical protein
MNAAPAPRSSRPPRLNEREVECQRVGASFNREGRGFGTKAGNPFILHPSSFILEIAVLAAAARFVLPWL